MRRFNPAVILSRSECAALLAELETTKRELLLTMEQRDRFSDKVKEYAALLATSSSEASPAIARDSLIYNDLLRAAMSADAHIHATAHEPMTDAERAVCEELVDAIGPALDLTV